MSLAWRGRAAQESTEDRPPLFECNLKWVSVVIRVERAPVQKPPYVPLELFTNFEFFYSFLMKRRAGVHLLLER
jgi:hypothetical protein